MESYVLIYLLAANVAAFLVFGIDKWKAVKGRWRIPEKTLLLLRQREALREHWPECLYFIIR